MNRRASGGTFGTGSDVLVVCNDSQTVRQLRLFISTKYTSINCTTTTNSSEISGSVSGGRGSGPDATAAHEADTAGDESVLLANRFYRFLEQRAIVCLRKTRNLDAAAELLRASSSATAGAAATSPVNGGQAHISASHVSKQDANRQAFMAKKMVEQQRRTALGKRNAAGASG
jgi:hypothetical protein